MAFGAANVAAFFDSNSDRISAPSGVASVLFGLMRFARPGVGALAVIWIVGAYAVVFGVLLVAVVGFRVKSLRRIAVG